MCGRNFVIQCHFIELQATTKKYMYIILHKNMPHFIILGGGGMLLQKNSKISLFKNNNQTSIFLKAASDYALLGLSREKHFEQFSGFSLWGRLLRTHSSASGLKGSAGGLRRHDCSPPSRDINSYSKNCVKDAF